MNKKDTIAKYTHLAERTARSLCAMGGCFSGYNCGHADRKTPHPLPLMGADKECPIAKYNTEPPSAPTEIDENGLFAICACCPHTKGAKPDPKDNRRMIIDADDNLLTNHCIDCPVQMAWENMQEAKAEAGCS